MRMCLNWCNGMQGSHYMAVCKEAYNQLKQQLTTEGGQREELRRQLQDGQRQLDEAHSTIAARQQAEHRHTAELRAVKAELKGERQISAKLQDELGYARREVYDEQQGSSQLRAQLQQASLQPIQSMLHLVSSLLDAVIIPGAVTCLTQTWLLKACSEPCVCGFCCEPSIHVSGQRSKQLQSAVCYQLMMCDDIYGKPDVPHQLMNDAQHRTRCNPVCLQVRADLTEVTTEAAARSSEATRLNCQLQELQRRVQAELKAAAAASHSAAQVGWKLCSL